ncbi:hypothetical protein [Pseudaestuariivita atlantica]|uniref:Histidinol phosphate aminotransferase n=1 Tax=Pseudaestuariivita atlantica TaxID=1317121 RepID=A0A0L1JLV7_9RHOB|nr:hypothetical protein [Pseudaestuariivita atlantica]KNG92739.1 hypothetical protein ATO11_14765 [Pseudaestuariivita atlantica]
MRHPMKEAPNYTNACLVMGFVNLFWMFIFIWITIGMWAVMATGYAIDKCISWLARRRAT